MCSGRPARHIRSGTPEWWLNLATLRRYTPELLFEAIEDRLHQGHRAAAMPDTKNLVAGTYENAG
jgi:hypothetical protein